MFLEFLIGTFAVPAIMTASTIIKYDGILYESESRKFNYPLNLTLINANLTQDEHPTYLHPNPTTAKIMIGMCLSFYCGVIQVSKDY